MFYAVKIKKLLIRLTAAAVAFIFAAACVYVVNRYFPVKYTGYINEYSKKYGLPPELVCAVINAESRFNPSAVSKKGASGLMQLIEGTADWGASQIGLAGYDYGKIHEPEINIELGCWYLSYLLNQYDGDLTLALSAYNAGSGNVAKWLQNKAYSADGATLAHIPFRETRNYVKKVNIYVKVYDLLLKFG